MKITKRKLFAVLHELAWAGPGELSGFTTAQRTKLESLTQLAANNVLRRNAVADFQKISMNFTNGGAK